LLNELSNEKININVNYILHHLVKSQFQNRVGTKSTLHLETQNEKFCPNKLWKKCSIEDQPRMDQSIYNAIVLFNTFKIISNCHMSKINVYSSMRPFNVYLYTMSHDILIINHTIIIQYIILICMDLFILSYLFWIFRIWTK